MKGYRHLLNYVLKNISPLGGLCKTYYLDLENVRAAGKAETNEFSASKQLLSALSERFLTLCLGWLESVAGAWGLHGEVLCIQIVPPPNRQPNWLIVGSAITWAVISHSYFAGRSGHLNPEKVRCEGSYL